MAQRFIPPPPPPPRLVRRDVDPELHGLILRASVGRSMGYGPYQVSEVARKAVLFALAGLEGVPVTYRAIADGSGMGQDSVKGVVLSLERDGLIEVDRDRCCRPNRYTIRRDRLAKIGADVELGSRPRKGRTLAGNPGKANSRR